MVFSEIGTIRKSWRGRIPVVLVYPNRYFVGMSSLGFQTVYELFNQMEDIVCERAFLPDDSESSLETIPIKSIESKQPLGNFHIIAFSISFEYDYINLLKILDKSRIPLRSEDRSDDHPLVIAGGVACFLNPEPIAPFIDCFLIGEGEILIPQFISFYKEAAENNSERYPIDRKTWLKSLCQNMDGVYVPMFYQERRLGENEHSVIPDPSDNVPETIKRVYVNDISQVQTCSAIVTPDTAFDNSYLIEVSRGCPHGCRFCSAGFVYRPPRFRPVALLKTCLVNSSERLSCSQKKIGLVGAAVSDLPGIETICHEAGEKDIQLSFSSLRADVLTETIVAALCKSRIMTATIAPDAGSQRMRNVINKQITEEHILNAVELLISHGIINLKLYFMIGLPTETMDDITAIVELCKKIKQLFLEASRIRKRIGVITVSVNPFIPKPFTPFQWAAMDNVNSLKTKIKIIRNGLKSIPNVRIQAENPRISYIQALLSRGDRSISEIILLAAFNIENWSKTLKETTINTDDYVYRIRTEHEQFPWDIIDHGIDKSFLFQEYQKAQHEKTSLPCPLSDTFSQDKQKTKCSACGVCQKEHKMR